MGMGLCTCMCKEKNIQHKNNNTDDRIKRLDKDELVNICMNMSLLDTAFYSDLTFGEMKMLKNILMKKLIF